MKNEHPPRAVVPDLTSAEGLAGYPPGELRAASGGPAWRDVELSVFKLASTAEAFDMPAVSEPFIAWIVSGEGETAEREVGAQWLHSRIKPGSLFITMSGVPYQFQWTRLSPEPIEVVLCLISVPLFERAVVETYGERSAEAHLRNASAVDDPGLLALLAPLRAELNVQPGSTLLVTGLAQAIAVYLARHYMDVGASLDQDAALPAYKLRTVTDWMEQHLDQPFNLGVLAARAGMSTFHFNRLFKRATGLPPSQYQIKLRMNAARRLLRETDHSVAAIANTVGYGNPSHFSQLFRKHAGMAPDNYRRQR